MMDRCWYCPRPCATCGGEVPHRCFWCDYGERGLDDYCWVQHRHAEDPPGTYPRRFLRLDLRYRYCSPSCAEPGRVRRRAERDARKARTFCLTCNAELRTVNHLRKYCSNACRQRAYRRKYRRKKDYEAAIAFFRMKLSGAA